MELTNDFRVSAPPAEAWRVLTDVERIAPMLPGAQLQEVEGDEFRGVVKVKVGPITAQYKGTATFEEQDEAAGRVVLKASGRDTRGQGNASATITAILEPDGAGTKVSVVTDLSVTGKVAQFGRGVLADVSAKLIGQFVDALEADLRGGGTPAADPQPAADEADEAVEETPAAVGTNGAVGASEAGANGAAAPAGGEAGSGPRRIDSPEPEPVDLLDAAGGSVFKRLIPVLAGLGAVATFVLVRRLRRR